jgi:CheY-like chemotaxis protein
LHAIFRANPPEAARSQANPAQDSQRGNKNVASRSLEAIKILAVDDHVDSGFVLKVFLEHFGAQVVAVESAPAALVEIQRHKPDVVICDIDMPGMDGYQLLKKIRKLEAEIGWVHAIACTAHVGWQDVARTLAAGFQAYVPKPIQPSKLVETILSVVQSRSESSD